jgi:hypothetical protein
VDEIARQAREPDSPSGFSGAALSNPLPHPRGKLCMIATGIATPTAGGLFSWCTSTEPPRRLPLSPRLPLFPIPMLNLEYTSNMQCIVTFPLPALALRIRHDPVNPHGQHRNRSIHPAAQHQTEWSLYLTKPTGPIWLDFSILDPLRSIDNLGKPFAFESSGDCVHLLNLTLRGALSRHPPVHSSL